MPITECEPYANGKGWWHVPGCPHVDWGENIGVPEPARATDPSWKEDAEMVNRVRAFIGHVEDLPADERVFLLGYLSEALARRMGGVPYVKPGPQEPGEPAMIFLGPNRTKRFACPECGANVFTRRGDRYTCNGCQSVYLGT
jgi:ribosomal protein S27AE